MKNTKRIFELVLALMMMLLMAGCGSSEEEIIVEESEPERIISVAPNMTELLYALGAGDKLIARSDYCDYPEEALELESVGALQTPDVEKMISLDPDLVIVSDMVDDQLLGKLEDVGISILQVEDETELSQVYDMITMVGTKINRMEEAKVLIEDMKSTIAEVEEKVAGLEAPSVYYVVSYGEYGDATPGGDTFMHGIITAAGGENIGKDITGWAINLEEIIEKDPDIIILPSYYDGAFQTADHYKDLTAVKEGRVYVIDPNMVDRQGYRNAEAVRTLAEIFHPEAFE